MSKQINQLAVCLMSLGLIGSCAGEDGGATMGSYLNLEYDESLQAEIQKVCGKNSDLRGIDVSKWNGTVDWAKVVKDPNYDIKFAIARVSDGLKYPDSKFDENWQGIKDAGLIRGVYQFFRPSQDAIKQADYLLNKIGSKLEPNDLPPVIDVEADDSLSPSVVAAGVQKWVDRVESVLGVKPIIYTGGYFWDGKVKIPNMDQYPLWHAAYPNTWSQKTSCPSISNSWSNWTMWQYSSSAHIQGIKNGTGDVDINVINGSLEDLLKLTYKGRACEAVPANGAIIDNKDACFVGGGNPAYLRTATDAGWDGDLRWSKTWVSERTGNYGQWNLNFAKAGTYRLDTYLSSQYGEYDAVPYKVTHNGVTDVVKVDQTGHDGWKEVGTFYFSAEEGQNLVIDDMVDDAKNAGKKFILDAIRLVPVALDNSNEDIDYTASCYAIPANGRIIDETDGCFVGGGDEKWLRQVNSMGYDSHLIWSNTKSGVSTEATSTGTWNFNFVEAGSYELSVFIPDLEVKELISKASGKNICSNVQYDVKADGEITHHYINQTSTNGWYSLGAFDFAAGDDQYVQVKDTIDDAAFGSKTFLIDAVKVARIYEDGEDPVDLEENNQDHSGEYVAPVEDIDNIQFDYSDDKQEQAFVRDFDVEDQINDNYQEENIDDKPLFNEDSNANHETESGDTTSKDDTGKKSGCNSQAGDVSVFSALMLAVSLFFSKRRRFSGK